MKSWLENDPDSYPSDKEFVDTNMGIMARAHAILRITEDLHDIAHILREVNMDRLANRLTGSAKYIAEMAAPIPGIVTKELNEGIAHGEHMMGGLLHLALKMSDGKSS